MLKAYNQYYVHHSSHVHSSTAIMAYPGLTRCLDCVLYGSQRVLNASFNSHNNRTGGYGRLHGHLQVQVWRVTWTPSGPGMKGYMDTFRSRYGGLHGHLQVQVWRTTWTPSGPGMEGYMDTFRSRYGGLHGHLQVQVWRATWTPSGPGMEGYMDTFRSRYGGLHEHR